MQAKVVGAQHGNMRRQRDVEQYARSSTTVLYEIQDNNLAGRKKPTDAGGAGKELDPDGCDQRLPLSRARDSHAHEVLLCIQTGKTIDESNR